MSEYIERNTFIAEQRHLYCDNCARRKNSKGKLVYDIGDAPCRACDICDVLDAVEDAPAADVRTAVRGRWEWDVLDGTPGYRPVVLCCSNCHRVSFSGWDYCPNCGADMREGET